MPIISFDRKIVVTPEQYQKMLETTMPKEIQEALEEYQKNPYEYVTDPTRIREMLGEWAKKD